MTIAELSRQDAPVQGGANSVTEFNYRRPDVLPKVFVESIDAVHTAFLRTASDRLSQLLKTEVDVQPVTTEELTYRNYLWSLPTPTFIAVATMLRGRSGIEFAPELVSVLNDRLLGGRGMPTSGRWPTSLDAALAGHAMEPVAAALNKAFAAIMPMGVKIERLEHNPRFARLAAMTDSVLASTFAVKIEGRHPFTGSMSLCYPFATLDPLFDTLRQQLGGDADGAIDDDKPERALLESFLRDSTVPLAARLRPSQVPAGQLSQIEPGDVVVLDHWADEPVDGLVGGTLLFDGRIGRQGNNLAFEVTAWKEDA